MPQNVAVVTVHGINVTRNGYSAPLVKGIKSRLPRALQPLVSFHEVFWADVIRARRQGFLDRAQQVHVRPSRFRDLTTQALGDAAAYQKTRERKNSAYYDIQACIYRTLQAVEVGYGSRLPLIFVGHSLGCHIISSFVWDVHKWRASTDADIAGDDLGVQEFARHIRGGSPLIRLETLAGLVTLGNNMPLFTFTFGPNNVYPITLTPYQDRHAAFPGPGLSDAVRDQARWINIYSPRDPLGFPLKPLNKHYANEKRLRDIDEHVEAWYWPSPYDAHVRYWWNPKVHRESASLIQAIVEAA